MAKIFQGKGTACAKVGGGKKCTALEEPQLSGTTRVSRGKEAVSSMMAGCAHQSGATLSHRKRGLEQ